MTTPYSLCEIKRDGPVRAPRWVHHLIKIATHALVAAGLYAVLRLTTGHGHPIVSAVIGGPLLHLIFVAHEHFWPTDVQPLTAWQHWADWINDHALSDVPLAVILLVHGSTLIGGLLAGGIVGAWLACHRNARP
jgi:hypothetical protein